MDRNTFPPCPTQGSTLSMQRIVRNIRRTTQGLIQLNQPRDSNYAHERATHMQIGYYAKGQCCSLATSNFYRPFSISWWCSCVCAAGSSRSTARTCRSTSKSSTIHWQVRGVVIQNTEKLIATFRSTDQLLHPRLHPRSRASSHHRSPSNIWIIHGDDPRFELLIESASWHWKSWVFIMRSWSDTCSWQSALRETGRRFRRRSLNTFRLRNSRFCVKNESWMDDGEVLSRSFTRWDNAGAFVEMAERIVRWFRDGCVILGLGARKLS